jgi:hypothetical protein
MANNRTFFISSMISDVRLRKFKVGIASHYLLVMRFVHFPYWRRAQGKRVLEITNPRKRHT